MNHKFPAKFSFQKGQTEIHLQCENGCGVELIRSKTTSKVGFRHPDGRTLSYAPICKPVKKENEIPAIVVPSEALHMQPVKEDHEWEYSTTRGAYDEYICKKGCSCKKLIFGSGITIYMSALNRRTENKPACVKVATEEAVIKTQPVRPVVEKKPVQEGVKTKTGGKIAEEAPLFADDGSTKENKIRFTPDGKRMHRFPRLAVKQYPAGVHQMTVVCVDCGCRCIKYKTGGVAYVNREGNRQNSGVSCTPDEPYTYKEEITTLSRSEQSLNDLKEAAREHNEITGNSGDDAIVTGSIDPPEEETGEEEEEVMTISDIEDAEIPITTINPKIQVPSVVMRGDFQRAITKSEVDNKFNNGSDKGGVTEESPLHIAIKVQVPKGNRLTDIEARLQEALVLMKCMYEDMVKHEVRTRVRDMAGRYLYSNGYQESVNYLDDQRSLITP